MWLLIIAIKKRKASNMKKNGFTLAEVLITLGIVGFIASITIPSLVVSAGNRQAATAFKKSLYTISNAAAMSNVISGVDFSNMSSTTEILPMLRQTANVLTNASIGIDGSATPKHTITGGDADNLAVFFGDGTILHYNSADVTGGEVKAVIDINGKKGPNELYNCTDANCSQGVKNFDNFAVKLNGTRVLPSSHAARWLQQQ